MKSNNTAVKIEPGDQALALEPAEIAIDAQGVGVQYRSYHERPTTLKENILNFFKSGKISYSSTFPALQDISFQVEKGKIQGFIGSNGAGKSTLLNVLAGVLPPTSGGFEIRGSVDSLRSLGAGFDSELNAIENIYLYGSLRGQSRSKIKGRIPHILDFAELHDFANTPIKYYSSGMSARLGFACAIDTDPDVLLVDEVLAVGDARFKEKCEKVMEDLLSRGRTVVMVSHSMPTMKNLCHKVGVLSQGRLVFNGDPEEAVEIYLNEDYKTRLTDGIA